MFTRTLSILSITGLLLVVLAPTADAARAKHFTPPVKCDNSSYYFVAGGKDIPTFNDTRLIKGKTIKARFCEAIGKAEANVDNRTGSWDR